MSDEQLHRQLQALISRWDALAHEAKHRGDNTRPRRHSAHHYGIQFGLELARDELARLLAQTMGSLAQTGDANSGLA